MSDRGYPDISFVETDVNTLVSSMVSAYELIANKKLYPASPERLFILWAADIIIQLREIINWSAKQNVPRYAEGEYLDSLAELFHGMQRLDAAAATTTIRFYITEEQPSAQLIPLGTRVTVDGSITFETTEAVYIPAGDLYADAPAICQQAGIVGNGFVAGQITTLVDVYPFYDFCENLTTSEGGSEAEDDDSFYARMRESGSSYSTAGPMGGYVYFAKSVSTAISDVKVTSPDPGEVNVYILMAGGQLPGSEMIDAVEAALSADNVRPLTDHVTVLAPDPVSYDIGIEYYIPVESAASSAAIEAAVAAAVETYKAWQCERMGRDINPSKLVALVMEAGVKRVAISAPAYKVVYENEVAALNSQSVVNGGIESE